MKPGAKLLSELGIEPSVDNYEEMYNYSMKMVLYFYSLEYSSVPNKLTELEFYSPNELIDCIDYRFLNSKRSALISIEIFKEKLPFDRRLFWDEIYKIIAKFK